MSRIARRWLLAACLIVCPAWAGDFERGTVIVVIDGDTVLFRADRHGHTSRRFEKLRLAGIDAPELDQPGGADATRALSALALGRVVEVRTVATDRYGRRLAHLFADNMDLNVELVRRGHAWVSSRARSSAALAAAAEEARAARRGIWGAPDPVPPWVWRRRGG